MTQELEGARALQRLLKRVGRGEPEFPDAGDPIASLVLSFLMWNAGLSRAAAAFRRLREAVVDFNDLRVCLPDETAAIIGERFPQGPERCQRLRAALNDLYAREHAVTLERVAALGKREARRYVESLEGMVPYVSTRVCLMNFDVHGIPVDDILQQSLMNAGIAQGAANAEEVSQWVTRHVSAGNGRTAHWGLEQWADRRAKSSGASKRAAGGGAARRSSRSRAKSASRAKTRRKAGAS